MKKLICLAFAAVMSLSLIACGGTKNPAKDNGSDSQSEKPNPVSEFEYTIDSATEAAYGICMTLLPQYGHRIKIRNNFRTKLTAAGAYPRGC